MIAGVVKADEGRIRLRVTGPQGHQEEIEAVIDTGYTGSLTVPPVLVAALGLRWRSVGRGTLADGSEYLFDVYEADILWDGKIRQVLVDEAEADALVGMRLLKGCELKMQIRPGGKVAIKRLSKK